MANSIFNLPKSTYHAHLTLVRDNASFEAGVCFSNIDFENLKAIRHQFLHDKECAYFSMLDYPKRQHSYLLGRFCAKYAAINFLKDQNVIDIYIDNGIFQQPIITCNYHSNLQISISHSDAIGAALAFQEAHSMAIDVEEINPDKVLTLQTQLTKAEQSLLFDQISDMTTRYTILWTAKEALSKILRCGFMIPFELLEINHIVSHENFISSTFKNFPQYQSLSFLLSNTACSLVYPKKTFLSLDINSIQTLLG